MLIFRLSQARRFLRIKDDGSRFLDLGKFPENRPLCQEAFIEIMMTIWAMIYDIIKTADQNST